MHEYSIVQALIDQVESVAAQNGGGTVHHIYVKLGDLAGVDPNLLQTAYETFRAGTVCDGAPLTIERVTTQWTCPRCFAPFQRGAVLRCSKCDEPARLAVGDEIVLRRIEMEVA
jgi:hydrogenase nickel incorporation protein HypA/HybF